MKEFKSAILNLIKEEVSRRGWSDFDFAYEMEEKPSTVGKWIYGNQFPRPERAKKLFRVLEVNFLEEEDFYKCTLGQKLFLLRHNEGLGYEEAAQAMMTSHYTLRAWEKDQKIPTDVQIRKIMRFYGVTEKNLDVNIAEETFGERLAEERTCAGLTQNDLGEIIEQNSNHISQYEQNNKVPTEEELEVISEALDLPQEALIIAEDGLPFEGFEKLYVQKLRAELAGN